MLLVSSFLLKSKLLKVLNYGQMVALKPTSLALDVGGCSAVELWMANYKS